MEKKTTKLTARKIGLVSSPDFGIRQKEVEVSADAPETALLKVLEIITEKRQGKEDCGSRMLQSNQRGGLYMGLCSPIGSTT